MNSLFYCGVERKEIINNFIEKDSKWQAEVLKKEIASLREFNDEKTREAQELRTKLDDAYTRIQEMALEQAKASTPRVIETAK